MAESELHAGMPRPDTELPQTDEVERQLERMLAGKRFAAAPSQADFLALVVRRTLKGKKTTEDMIGRALFGTKFKKDESTDVRVTASNLRRALKNYLANEGREDRVAILLPEPPKDRRIKLPPGEAYTPLFSYNPNHVESQKFRLGSHYLNQISPDAIEQALGYFGDVVSTQAGHASARVALAEAITALSVYTTCYKPLKELQSMALQLASRATAHNPGDWHAHAAYGAALLCGRYFDQAGHEFDHALRLDRVQTQQYTWYAAFLFTIGRREEAVELARICADEEIEDAHTQAAYGIYLYALRRFDEAEVALKNAVSLDRNFWITRLALAALYLSLDRPEDAIGQYERVQVLADEEKAAWVMPGMAALCASRAQNLPSDQRRQIKWWAAELMDTARQEDSFQAALFFMSLGDIAEAIASVARACSERHPLTLWLDAWPILDPLRDHAAFQAVIALSRPQAATL